MKRIVATLAVAALLLTALVGGTLLKGSHHHAGTPLPDKHLTLGDIQLAAARGTVFLALDGITGPADAADHSKHAPLSSFAFGVSTTPVSGGTGGGSGRAILTDITVTKPVDQYSDELLKQAVQGTHIRTATIYIVGQKGAPTITMVGTDVLVGADNLSSDGLNAKEALTLRYRGLSYQLDEGTPIVLAP